ncbi:hypothetical protein BLOT_008797 [Blomia tropicalis]|nr:hypothetical protein BLOT_008797 [Blomia tropicalis]
MRTGQVDIIATKQVNKKNQIIDNEDFDAQPLDSIKGPISTIVFFFDFVPVLLGNALCKFTLVNIYVNEYPEL